MENRTTITKLQIYLLFLSIFFFGINYGSVKNEPLKFSRTYLNFQQNEETPKIYSFLPLSCSVGGIVEIHGEHLENVQSVSIGTTAAIPVSKNGTILKIMVMPGTVAGAITLITNSGSVSSTDNLQIIPSTTPNKQLGGRLDLNEQAIVAINADGTIAIIGGLTYERTSSGWVKKGDAFIGNSHSYVDLDISANGEKVAAITDGKTAIYNYNDTTLQWEEEAQLLSLPIDPVLPTSINISADGTIVALGFLENKSVQIFKYDEIQYKWIKSVTLANNEATQFASKIALSADGTTLAVAGINKTFFVHTEVSTVWVYHYDANSGTLEEKTHFEGAQTDSETFPSIALDINANGKKILAGDLYANDYKGSVMLYTNTSGTTWTTAEITDDLNRLYFGQSVALSADGNTAVINYAHVIGKTLVITFDNEMPTQYERYEFGGFGGDDTYHNTSLVALSADGNNVLILSPGDIGFGDGLVLSLNNQSVIHTSTTDFIPFITTVGTASTTQSITVFGTNLSHDIVVKAPTGFEISTNPNFSDGGKQFITLPKGGAYNYNGPLYVRISNSTVIGTLNGAIILSSGAVTKTISISGTVVDLLATADSTTTLTTTYGTASENRAIHVSGSTSLSDITVAVSNTYFELSVDGSTNWQSTIILPKNETNTYSGDIFLRLKATAPAGSRDVTINFTTTNNSFELPKISSLINKAPLTIKASNVSKVYGEALTNGITTAFISNGLKNGESIESVYVTYGAGALATEHVNNYSNSITLSNPTGTEFNTSNYDIMYEAGTIIVTKAPLSITPNVRRVYGEALAIYQSGLYSQAVPITDFIITGLKNNDYIYGAFIVNNSNDLGFFLPCTPPGNYGPIKLAPDHTFENNYAISANDPPVLLSFDQNDYNITFNEGTFTITKAPLTVDISEIYRTEGSIWNISSTIGAKEGAIVTGLKNGQKFIDLNVTLNQRYDDPGTSAFANAVHFSGISHIRASEESYSCRYSPHYYYLTQTPAAGALITHPIDCYDNRWNKENVRIQSNNMTAFQVNIRKRGTVTLNPKVQIKNVTKNKEITVDYTAMGNTWSVINNGSSIYSRGYDAHANTVMKESYANIPADWSPTDHYELGLLTYPFLFVNPVLSGCFSIGHEQKSVILKENDPEIANNIGTSPSFTVYPNPTSSVLHIEYLPQTDGEIVFSIVNLLGTELATQTFSGKKDEKLNTTFNLKEKGLASGVYMTKVINSRETLTQKIIVE